MPTAIDIQTHIDSQPIGWRQKLVFCLCFLVVALDGFDTAAIGYIAPAIAQQWQIDRSALAPLFGAGLFGMMLGAMIMGPLADRVGRKPVMIGSVLMFGSLCLLSAFSNNVEQLVLMRFLTGMGLGGAMPMAIALTAEYAPSPRRAGLVTLMFCGFTIGSASGGLISAQLMSVAGWQSVLIAGGVAPLLLVPVLLMQMPESLRYLAQRHPSDERLPTLLRQIHPGLSSPPALLADEPPIMTPLRELFTGRYALGTCLLWTVTFSSLLIVYLVSSWMPTLLSMNGLDLSQAARVTSAFQIGGTVGAIVIGQVMDRLGAYRTLCVAYALGAVFTLLFAFGDGSLGIVVLAIFGMGAFISGSMVGANALAAQFYPTTSRASGISWALSAGRVGSVVGSLIGGWLIAMQLPLNGIVGLLAAPALVAALSVGWMGAMEQRLPSSNGHRGRADAV